MPPIHEKSPVIATWEERVHLMEPLPSHPRGTFQNLGLSPANFILPVFVSDSTDTSMVHPIRALPGQSKFGTDAIVEFLKPLVHDFGLKAVILFGVVECAMKNFKNDEGSLADACEVDLGGRKYTNPVITAIRKIKHAFGQSLLVIADVCLCSYTSSGHCGIMDIEADGYFHPNAGLSHKRLAQVAVSYASHGADIIAPSDMIIGRIGPMRQALDASGNERIPIMSYAIKYCSAFYGPFRSAVSSASGAFAESQHLHAAHSSHDSMDSIVRNATLASFATESPAPYIDRSTYQLNPAKSKEELTAIAEQDIRDGAAYLMVKPSTSYLDVLQQTAASVSAPLGVYHTSGEYCQLYYAAKLGALDLSAALEEVCLSFARAGATFIISYFTPFILMKLKGSSQIV